MKETQSVSMIKRKKELTPIEEKVLAEKVCGQEVGFENGGKWDAQ